MSDPSGSSHRRCSLMTGVLSTSAATAVESRSSSPATSVTCRAEPGPRSVFRSRNPPCFELREHLSRWHHGTSRWRAARCRPVGRLPGQDRLCHRNCRTSPTRVLRWSLWLTDHVLRTTTRPLGSVRYAPPRSSIHPIPHTGQRFTGADRQPRADTTSTVGASRRRRSTSAGHPSNAHPTTKRCSTLPARTITVKVGTLSVTQYRLKPRNPPREHRAQSVSYPRGGSPTIHSSPLRL